MCVTCTWYIQLCVTQFAILYNKLYKSVTHKIRCCVRQCTMMYCTLYNATLHIVQCFITQCTILCYKLYNVTLNMVQFFVTQCTILRYTVYNAVLHNVQCCVTLCKMNYNNCTMLHYTLYNRVKHMQCQINVLYYPVYKYILCAILYIHNVYKAVLNVVHFRVTLCTMLSYKDHYILLHSVQFFIIHNTMLYYTLYNAGYIMLRFKVMNIVFLQCAAVYYSLISDIMNCLL